MQERIVVRGNIKKRLDEAGNIIKTYWQPPHIKGPKDAPFRDQRYQVLADKIKREQELYHQFGIKNDPSLWMEEDEIVISSKTSSAQNSSRLQEVYKSVRDYISKQYHTLKARIAFYISKEA